MPPGDVDALASVLAELVAGAFADGVARAAVERARRRHSLERHVESVRGVFSDAMLARFGTSLTRPARRRLNPS